MASEQITAAKTTLSSLMEVAPKKVVQDGTLTETHDPLRVVQAAKATAELCAAQDDVLSVNPFAALRYARIVSCQPHAGGIHPMIR